MATTQSAPSEPTATARDAHASGLVIRSRLFDLLDQGALGAVTLVSAPPGSGKTTLVRSWLDSRGPTAAWVHIRRDETDETHFWGQVLDAIRESGAVGADSGLATLVPSPQAAPGDLLGHLLEGFRHLDKPLTLVLDDVHHLSFPGAPPRPGVPPGGRAAIGCASASSPAATRSSVCTACGWPASSPRSAPRTSSSLRTRPGNSSREPA